MIPQINYFTFLNLGFLRFNCTRLSQNDSPVPRHSIPFPEIKTCNTCYAAVHVSDMKETDIEGRYIRGKLGIWKDIIVVLKNIKYYRAFF